MKNTIVRIGGHKKINPNQKKQNPKIESEKKFSINTKVDLIHY